MLLHDRGADDAVDVAHEPFIDSLIERNAVLLGGPFGVEPAPGVSAAYLLRCGSVDEARALVAEDPLVAHGLADPQLIPWDLVGINPCAIDPSLVVEPTR